jgi:hypothetical protein
MAINAPWMAYCSALYLDQPERLVPIPGPWLIRHSPYAFGYRDTTVRFEDSLGLPQSIDLYTSKELMRKSPHRDLLVRNKSMNSIRTALRTPVPFKDNQLHCRYLVLESTNVGGWNIPLEFRIAIEPHHHDGRIVGMEVLGTAEHVVQVESVPQFNPAPGKTSVTDMRIKDEGKFLDAIRYTITNEPLPSIDDPRIKEALALIASRAPSDPAPAIRRRILWIYIMTSGILLLPMLIFLVRRFQSRKNKPT